MKRLFLCAVGVACLVAAQTPRAEPPAAYRYDPVLATIARETLWQAGIEDSQLERSDVLPVVVRCYRDQKAFESSFESRFRKSARNVVAYYAGGRNVYLRHGTCERVRALFKGELSLLTSGAYAVLLHESLHRQGVTNERITTCFADEAVRWGMRWYGFSDAQSLRGRDLAFTYTRLYAPASYRMGKASCLRLATLKSWAAFTR